MSLLRRGGAAHRVKVTLHPLEGRAGNPYGFLMNSAWNQQFEGMRNSYESLNRTDEQNGPPL
jgi:hypothetical protein